MVVKDTKMSIANNTDDGWGDDSPDVLEMEAEYQTAKDVEKAKRQKENSQKKGRLWLFQMPPPDATGTSTASGRILTPLQHNLAIIVHVLPNEGSNKVWKTVPCKGFLGFDCEYCTPICQKHNISWEELTDPAKMAYLDKYASESEWGYKTRWIYVWYFWHNEGFNDRGSVRLFAYARNQASPVDKLMDINRKRTKIAKEKGKRVVHVNEYDISLTQTGAGWQRQIVPYGEDPEPFEHMDKAMELIGHKMDRNHLLMDYFIAMERDESEIKKLRKLAAERLGDDSYLVVEDDGNDNKKQPQPVRKAASLPTPDLSDEDDDDEVDIEDFEGEE